MAYMGLTGSNDKTPADVAALVTADNLATGDSSMSSDAVEKVADSLGLVAKSYTSSRQTPSTSWMPAPTSWPRSGPGRSPTRPTGSW